jgi:hypothetical protein
MVALLHNGSQINPIKDMKEQILEIAEKLRLELITDDQAQDLLLGLFGVSSRFGGYCSKETLEGKRCKELCDKPHCGW